MDLSELADKLETPSDELLKLMRVVEDAKTEIEHCRAMQELKAFLTANRWKIFHRLKLTEDMVVLLNAGNGLCFSDFNHTLEGGHLKGITEFDIYAAARKAVEALEGGKE